MSRVLVFLFLSLAFSGVAQAASHCDSIILVKESPTQVGVLISTIDSTKTFISYLTELIERSLIGMEQLELFERALDENTLVNPLEERKGANSSIHYQEIQKYIDSGQLSIGQLSDWAKITLQKMHGASDSRATTEEETQSPYVQMRWNRVKAGSRQQGSSKDASIVLTKSFEMMASPVTQYQWAELMGGNPSHHSRGDDSKDIEVNGKVITMQPDHPVENIDWYEALEFANRLSERHGLKPAYDLSQLGVSRDSSGIAHSTPSGWVYPNNSERDIYKTEGYRLPTSAEWIYVIYARGQMSAEQLRSFWRVNPDTGRFPGWHSENSGGVTHAVEEMLPFSFDGVSFYDLIGNVWEWSFTEAGRSPLGVDIQPNGQGGQRNLHGGSFAGEFNDHLFDSSFRIEAGTKGDGMGFRLVRTVGPGK